MFTGIIEEQGIVRRISGSDDGVSLVINARAVLDALKIGDSIAVSGPCLTVTAVARDSFTAWVMPETIKKTSLQNLATGQAVNLERAMTLNGRLGGHLVSGHIDTVITLIDRQSDGAAFLLYFDAPENLLRYIIPKGSVALDGVSLTVAAVDPGGFSVGLIPHTAAQTTLGLKKSGSPINLEVDLIGKYVEKLLQPHREEIKEKGSSISVAFLQEKGYM